MKPVIVAGIVTGIVSVYGLVFLVTHLVQLAGDIVDAIKHKRRGL